jgi:hypothetical protein
MVAGLWPLLWDFFSDKLADHISFRALQGVFRSVSVYFELKPVDTSPVWLWTNLGDHFTRTKGVLMSLSTAEIIRSKLGIRLVSMGVIILSRYLWGVSSSR